MMTTFTKVNPTSSKGLKLIEHLKSTKIKRKSMSKDVHSLAKHMSKHHIRLNFCFLVRDKFYQSRGAFPEEDRVRETDLFHFCYYGLSKTIWHQYYLALMAFKYGIIDPEHDPRPHDPERMAMLFDKASKLE